VQAHADDGPHLRQHIIQHTQAISIRHLSHRTAQHSTAQHGAHRQALTTGVDFQ
jgi:hypothetical protein